MGTVRAVVADPVGRSVVGGWTGTPYACRSKHQREPGYPTVGRCRTGRSALSLVSSEGHRDERRFGVISSPAAEVPTGQVSSVGDMSLTDVIGLTDEPLALIERCSPSDRSSCARSRALSSRSERSSSLSASICRRCDSAEARCASGTTGLGGVGAASSRVGRALLAPSASRSRAR
jgi:hypothetical protein